MIATMAAMMLIVQMPALAGEARTRSAQIEWAEAGAYGPGTTAKVLLSKENGFLDNRIRMMLLVKVDRGGEYKPNAGLKEDYAVFVAKGEGQFSLQDKVVETVAGDAFYAGGAPTRDKHAFFNESHDVPLTYLAIGVPIPRARGGGGNNRRAGIREATSALSCNESRFSRTNWRWPFRPTGVQGLYDASR